MEPTVLKRDGLMWRLANYYGGWNPRDWQTYTICDYRSKALWGVFKLLAMLAAGSGMILLPLGDFLAYAAAIFVTGVWMTPNEPAFMFIAMVSIVSALASIIGLVIVCVNLWPKKETPSQPGPIALAYRSWKEKACYLVKFD